MIFRVKIRLARDCIASALANRMLQGYIRKKEIAEVDDGQKQREKYDGDQGKLDDCGTPFL